MTMSLLNINIRAIIHIIFLSIRESLYIDISYIK